MAKWGEGDPRWIVEERADATNVNNWHWTEKDATPWSKDQLTTLLEGLKIQDDNHSCEIKEITTIEGEASANNRKAKLIFFYEWNIKASWKGNVVGSDSSHKGNLEIPNLSEENDPEDIDVIVSTSSEKEEALKVKEFMQTSGSTHVRKRLAQYIEDLKIKFGDGMILPSKVDQKETPQSKNVAKSEISKPVMSSESPKDGSASSVKIPCKRLTDRVTFKCRAGELYRALTEKDMVQAFTRDEAKIKAEKGASFSLFGGNVTGEFKSLKPHEKIDMKWRFKSWPSGHFSSVTLAIKELDDCTELSLTQTGVPVNDLERTTEGWKRYYWHAIKQTFGFGADLI